MLGSGSSESGESAPSVLRRRVSLKTRLSQVDVTAKNGRGSRDSREFFEAASQAGWIVKLQKHFSSFRSSRDAVPSS